MDHRKIILFGKTAFCITLPQSWVKKHRLKKGDTVDVQETLRNSLEIIPAKTLTETMNTVEIDISERNNDEIISLLLATYQNGYSVINLRGINHGKVALVRQYVNELIAAEIMEVTSSRIVINVMWDVSNINLHYIIGRINNIIKSLLTEMADSVRQEGNPAEIVEKGYEVQRQVLLARRAITYALNDSSTAQKYNLSSLELYYISYIIYFFGKIGEYIVEIAKVLAESSKGFTPTARTEFKKMIMTTQEYFEKAMESYNKQGRKETIKIDKNTYEEEINNAKSIKAKVPIISEYIKMIIAQIRETELVILQMEMSPK